MMRSLKAGERGTYYPEKFCGNRVVEKRNKRKSRGNTRRVGSLGRFWAARVNIQDRLMQS